MANNFGAPNITLQPSLKSGFDTSSLTLSQTLVVTRFSGRLNSVVRRGLVEEFMKKLNWEIIMYNITDAREQLQNIEEKIKNGMKISEPEFEIMLEHAYHHLNFA